MDSRVVLPLLDGLLAAPGQPRRQARVVARQHQYEPHRAMECRVKQRPRRVTTQFAKPSGRNGFRFVFGSACNFSADRNAVDQPPGSRLLQQLQLLLGKWMGINRSRKELLPKRIVVGDDGRDFERCSHHHMRIS